MTISKDDLKVGQRIRFTCGRNNTTQTATVLAVGDIVKGYAGPVLSPDLLPNSTGHPCITPGWFFSGSQEAYFKRFNIADPDQWRGKPGWFLECTDVLLEIISDSNDDPLRLVLTSESKTDSEWSKQGRFLSGIDQYSDENYNRPPNSPYKWL